MTTKHKHEFKEIINYIKMPDNELKVYFECECKQLKRITYIPLKSEIITIRT